MRQPFNLDPSRTPAELQDLLNRAGFLSRSIVTRLHDPVPRTYDTAYFQGTYQNTTSYLTGFEQWREPGRISGTAGGTVAYTVNRLIAIPFIVNAPFAIDRLQFNVTTAGAAGSKARVGLYNSIDDRGGYIFPWRLLYDGGEQATTATGVKTATLDPAVNVEPGRVYWIAYVAGTAAPTVRSVPLAAAAPVVGVANTMGTAASYFAVYAAYTYAALPSIFPQPLLLTPETSNLPALQFRQSRPSGWSQTTYYLGTWPIESGHVLRRARLVPSSSLARAGGSARDAYLTVACGLRSRSQADTMAFETLGRVFDSRTDDLKAGTPFDLVTQEARVGPDAGLYVRMVQGGWPALAIPDASVEWTIGYEGGS